jgi:phage baseplate assembly protein W
VSKPFAAPFTSLHYPFALDPAQGQVLQERDYSEHIDQLVRQVLLTAPGERIMRPDFGCGIKRLVFAPGGEVSATLAQTVIFQSLNQWLGSVISVHEVSVTAAEERLDIRIGYAIRARGERRYLNLQVTL